MFDRLTIRASDLAASQPFYDAVLPALGADGTADLAIVAATPQEPVTRHLHVGLVAASQAHVRAFWQAGIDAGFTSDGEPGPRPDYAPDYYGGFLLDPDGNSIEAVCGGALREGGSIDHLWIRVGHVGMVSRFYTATAAHAGDGSTPGYALVASGENFSRFRGPCGGSLTVIEGATPTRGLDLIIGGARFLDDDGQSLRVRAAT